MERAVAVLGILSFLSPALAPSWGGGAANCSVPCVIWESDLRFNATEELIVYDFAASADVIATTGTWGPRYQNPGQFVAAFDRLTGATLWTQKTGREWYYSSGGLEFSPDGSRLFVSYARDGLGFVRLIDARTGGVEWVGELPGVSRPRAPAFSPDGSIIFLGAEDSILAMTAANGSLLWRTYLSNLGISEIRPGLSAGGVFLSGSPPEQFPSLRQFLALNTDGSIRWSHSFPLQTGFLKPNGAHNQFQLSSDGSRVYEAVPIMGSGIKVVNATTGQLELELAPAWGSNGAPQGLLLLPNGDLFVIGTLGDHGFQSYFRGGSYQRQWAKESADNVALSLDYTKTRIALLGNNMEQPGHWGYRLIAGSSGDVVADVPLVDHVVVDSRHEWVTLIELQEYGLSWNGASFLQTTPFVPASQVVNLRATPRPESGEIELSWDAPEQPGEYPISGYSIMINNETRINVGPDTRIYSDSTRPISANRSYTVHAVSIGGDGIPAVVNHNVSRPSAPRSPSGTYWPGGTLSLTWSAPVNAGGTGVWHYRVFEFSLVAPDDLRMIGETKGNFTHFVVERPTPGSNYRVTAVNLAALESDPSEQACVVGFVAPVPTYVRC